MDLKQLPTGTNLRLLFQECHCDLSHLYFPDTIVPSVQQAICKAGLQFIKSAYHSFDEAGYTAVFILAESHVVIHSWPEYERLILIDVSVCDYYRSNKERTLKLETELRKVFQPELYLVEHSGMTSQFVEANDAGRNLTLDITRLLETRKSRFQEIALVETSTLGRALILDHVLQTTEKDAPFYHEPLVHVPLLSQSSPKTVLICGGGDGGAAREVLKHPSIKKCVVVEIDSEVVELSKNHLQNIHGNIYEDHRIELVTADAKDYFQQTTSSFDAIIMDTTDPNPVSYCLYTREFYRLAHQALSPKGVLGFHVGMPMEAPGFSSQTMMNAREIFPSLYPYLSYVPGYGGMMGFGLAFASQVKFPTEQRIRKRIEKRQIQDLQIISPAMFSALFAIPPIFQPILQPETNQPE
ncbi:polyamine aminopropyltransferase [bacterium]|nr:polyamine aminopropyltransferase [bacterium]